MRIAIVHEWLVEYAGAERALEQIIKVFPEADLYSTVDFIPEKGRGFIMNKHVKTTFIQKIPFARKWYRYYLFLMPMAVEQHDLSGYDLIISSSHAVAKGVITGPDQLHICYCYSPIRYAWDLQHQYLKESGLDKGIRGILTKWMLHKIRIWDVRTSNGVDHFIAISDFIARRIRKVYHRDSFVINCPVDTDSFLDNNIKKEDFYVTASRMVPYKKIDLIVETFAKSMPNKKLVVIGDGPDFKKIKLLSSSNVKLMGFQEFKVLKDYLGRAKAFIFAAEEDFGIAPLEAQALGTPVIAFGKGGALETIKGLDNNKPTGVFFNEQTIDSLAGAVNEFEENVGLIKAEYCINNAEKFSNRNFRKKFRSFVEERYENWKLDGRIK